MPVRSVIDIDLDSAKFERFKALFDEYTKQLAKTPDIWKNANKEQQATAQVFERRTAALLAQNQIIHEGSEEDKNRLTRLGHSERLWTSMAHSSAAMAKNVLDIGAGVLKWGAIIGGGLLGGALFGLDRLGSATSSERRSSMGLGLSIGQQQAFATNFSRFVNPDSFLSGISTAVGDISKRGPLYSLGVDPTNKSTEQVALATLRALQGKARATDADKLGILAASYGLSDYGIGTEELRRLRQPGSELSDQFAHYGKDVAAFNVGDDTAKKWQDFTTQMNRAGETIFRVFVNGLGPLAEPLEHLSGSLVKFLETMMKAPVIERGINSLAAWLDNFSGELAAPKFLRDVEMFVSDVGALAHAIHGAVDWLKGVPNVKAQPGAAVLGGVQGATNAEWRSKFLASYVAGTASKSDYLQLLSETEQQFKLPAGTLAKQWQLESSSAFNPKDSSTGAQGPFQFMPGTARSLGINPKDPLQAAFGAGEYDAELLSRYHGDMKKALAAYNYGEGNLDKVIATHPRDWQNYVPKETQNYVSAIAPGSGGVRIEINNNTGGNAVAVASALGE